MGVAKPSDHSYARFLRRSSLSSRQASQELKKFTRDTRRGRDDSRHDRSHMSHLGNVPRRFSEVGRSVTVCIILHAWLFLQHPIPPMPSLTLTSKPHSLMSSSIPSMAKLFCRRPQCVAIVFAPGKMLWVPWARVPFPASGPRPAPHSRKLMPCNKLTEHRAYAAYA